MVKSRRKKNGQRKDAVGGYRPQFTVNQKTSKWKDFYPSIPFVRFDSEEFGWSTQFTTLMKMFRLDVFPQKFWNGRDFEKWWSSGLLVSLFVLCHPKKFEKEKLGKSNVRRFFSMIGFSPPGF